MLHKIDHVGIAVTDIEEAIKTYQGLGFTLKGRDRVDSQKVETAFFQIGESCIELIAATEPDSPIAKFIEKNAGKGGLQQLAITVTDIEAELARLKNEGYTLINESPVPGAHGAKVAFVHPKDTEGVLLELCEHPTESH
jgi:methylmalonyl-CoA/ethylmalonyl-CoA epimerase